MTSLNKVYTFAEATSIWGLGEATLRNRASRGSFEDGDIRKSGDTWLVTDEAMHRIYGKPKDKERA